MKKLSKRQRTMLAIGVLLSTIPSFITTFTRVPDAVSGFIIGLGIALCIGLFVKSRKECRQGESEQ